MADHPLGPGTASVQKHVLLMNYAVEMAHCTRQMPTACSWEPHPPYLKPSTRHWRQEGAAANWQALQSGQKDCHGRHG